VPCPGRRAQTAGSPSADDGAGAEPKEPPMNPTPQPLAPDLQASLRHLRRIALGGALALAVLAGAAGVATPAHADAGKVSYSDLTRKVNEYEGQHRLAAAGDPSQWGLAGSKDPEVPVSPTLTRKVNEYEGQHR
jgi:hypothetical protein